MLYGIIADIHGNLEALGAVLSQLQKAEKIVCLGDLVGYGPNPDECVERIRDLFIPTVAGNHDKAVIGERELTWFSQSAREAIIWTQMKIYQEELDYLKSLPLVLGEDNFQFVHGSLREPTEEYLYSISDALPTFERMKEPLCFVGHSHIPLFIGSRKDGNYEGRGLQDGEEVVIDDYEKVIINVGGVGQPRDGDARASFGLYDSGRKIFSLHRIAYDVEAVQDKMRKAGLPVPLIERLTYGK